MAVFHESGRKRTFASRKRPDVLQLTVAVLVACVCTIIVIEASEDTDSVGEYTNTGNIIYNVGGKQISEPYYGYASTRYGPDPDNPEWTGSLPYNFMDVELTFKKGNNANAYNATVNLPNGYEFSDGTTSVSVDSNSFNNSQTVTITKTIVGSAALSILWGWSVVGDPNGTVYLPGEVLPKDPNSTDVQVEPAMAPIAGLDKTVFNCGGKNRVYDLTVVSSEIQVEAANDINPVTIEFGPDKVPLNLPVYNIMKNITVSGTLPGGLYKSDNGSGITFSKQVDMTGDAFFQDMFIDSTGYGQAMHANGKLSGLFACGHNLVFGDGLDSNSTKSAQFLQVFGGSHTNDPADNTTKAGKIIVHSGVFSNIVGGGQYANVSGDTYVAMRGGCVLDNIVGGNGGNYKNEKKPDPDNAINYVVTGNTYVYVLGGYMPADTYEQGSLGLKASKIDLNEASIVIGGSNRGIVNGSTNIFIAGTADIWDVQGAGRRGDSQVLSSNIEISGLATVRHMAAGSITDGIDEVGYKDPAVKTVSIRVAEGAKVGTVFGGGYDVFQVSRAPSMFGPECSITINIDGGTVGYVYGGGFRGSLGTPLEDGTLRPISGITINMNDGKVLNDIYGGGRGGVNKINHNKTGVPQNLRFDVPTRMQAFADITGASQVFADSISINLNGGEVVGSVFGGGQSVPLYSGSYTDGSITAQFGSNKGLNGHGVAYVECGSISIVSAGTGFQIGGSVFGGGRGIDPSALAAGTKPTITAVDSSGTVTEIPWYKGMAELTVDTDPATYLQYASARVSGTVTVSFDGFADSSQAADDGIFGGGKFGTLDANSIVITLKNSNVGKTVFGSGFGSSNPDMSEYGKVTSAGPVSITITGSTAGSSGSKAAVFGGGNYSSLEASSVSISATDSTLLSSILAGGVLGTTSVSDVTVDIRDTAVSGTVFGGGYGEKGTYAGRLTASNMIKLTVAGGSIGNGDLSMLGGGNFAPVDASQIFLDICEGTGRPAVNGSVLGGGFMGDVIAEKITINVDGAEVRGTVFGGGYGSLEQGLTELGKVTGKTVGGTVDPVSNINITITGNTSVDNPGKSVSVVGGGNFSYTKADWINISIKGKSVMSGDVHGGGIGQSVSGTSAAAPADKLSTQANRGIIVDDATITGNVYGGSRLGADGSTTDRFTAFVDIICGEVRQGVYGGGFQGKSFMDSTIRLGAAAAVSVSTDTVSGVLRINSVYGGGNMKDGAGTDILLEGDSMIAGSETAVSPDGRTYYDIPIRIMGAITGEGNFSRVAGVSTIDIDGFTSTAEQPLTTIQGADSLYIKDSVMYIAGASEISSVTITSPVSIADIGSLVLEGSTVLHLMAETSHITELVSNVDGMPASKAVCKDPSQRNEIVMYGGKMFIVLGPDNNGYVDADGDGSIAPEEYRGAVRGYILLSHEAGYEYYGAYALSSLATDAVSGFMVSEGNVEPSVLVGNAGYPIKTWYIAGHVERGLTMSLENTGTGVSGQVAMFAVGSGDSFFRYDGCILEPLSRDTLFLVDQVASPTVPNVFMGMSIGKAGDKFLSFDGGSIGVISHEYSADSWKPSQANTGSLGSGGNILPLELKLFSDPKVCLSGYIGDLVLTMTEVTRTTVGGVSEYIPINIVDVRISVNIVPTETNGNVGLVSSMSVVQNDDGSLGGSAHLILPGLGEKYDYSLGALDPVDFTADITVRSDNGYQGTSGWLLMKDPYRANASPMGQTVAELGTAGVKSAAVTLEFSQIVRGQGSDTYLTFDITAVPTDGTGTTYTYSVKINMKFGETVHLECIYLRNDDSHPYTEGESPAKVRHYLNVSGMGTPQSPYVLSWRTSSSGGFDVPFGTVPSKVQYYFDNGAAVSRMTMAEIIAAMVNEIPADANNGFSYSEHLLGFFTSETRVKAFAADSPMKADQDMFACFGITVKFNGEGAKMNVPAVTVEYGTTLHSQKLNDRGESIPGYLDISDYTRGGYTVAENTGWMDPDGNRFDFENDRITDDTVLHLVWEPNKYTLQVHMAFMEPYTGFTYTADGDFWYANTEPETQNGCTVLLHVRYGLDYTITVGEDFRVVDNFKEQSHELNLRGMGTRSITMTIPNADSAKTNGPPDITLGIQVVSAWTLTVELSGKNDALYSDQPLADTKVKVNGHVISIGDPLHFSANIAVPKNPGEQVSFEKSVTIELIRSTSAEDVIDERCSYALWHDDNGVFRPFDSNADRMSASSEINVQLNSDKTVVLAVYNVLEVSVMPEDVFKYNDGKSQSYYQVLPMKLDGTYGPALTIGEDPKNKMPPIYSWYKVQVTTGLNTSADIKYRYPAQPLGTRDQVMYKPGSTEFPNGGAEYVLDGTVLRTVIEMYEVPLQVSVHVNLNMADGESLDYYTGDHGIHLEISDNPSRPTVRDVHDFAIGDVRNGVDPLTGEIVLPSDMGYFEMAKANKYYLRCSFPGFTVTDQQEFRETAADGADILRFEVHMSPVNYVINYGYGQPVSVNAVSKDTSTNGPVKFSGPGELSDTAYTDADGNPVWISHIGGTSFVSGYINPDIFKGQTSIDLKEFAKVQYQGDAQPHQDAFAFVLESQWGTDVSVGTGFLNADTDLFDAEGHTIHFTKATGKLTLPKEGSGLGSTLYRDTAGNVTLSVLSISDVDAVEDRPPLLVL